jgi:hypothetical protein
VFRAHPLSGCVVPSLLTLLSNCFVGAALDSATSARILRTFADFCDSPEGAVFSVPAFSTVVHGAPARVLPLLDDAWLGLLLGLLDPAGEVLAGHVFVALDNIAFCSAHAAMRTIAAGFFAFEPPAEWAAETSRAYYRAVWTVVRRLAEYRGDARDALSEECIRAVRERAQTLVPALIRAMDDALCQEREAAAAALCALINLNDSELLHVATQSNTEIVGCCADLLLVRTEGLASAIVCALVRLCEFGDRLAFMDANPFLTAIGEIDMAYVLVQAAETYADSEIILRQIRVLEEEIARSREHEAIDLDQ